MNVKLDVERELAYLTDDNVVRFEQKIVEWHHDVGAVQDQVVCQERVPPYCPTEGLDPLVLVHVDR